VVSLCSTVAIVSLYEVGSWRDYRVLAPSFLCVFVLTVFIRTRHLFLLAIVFVQFLMLISFMPTFNDFRANNFIGSSAEELAMRMDLSQSISFTPSENRWCNTMLLFLPDQHDSRALRNLWISVPSGIGLSIVHNLDTLE